MSYTTRKQFNNALIHFRMYNDTSISFKMMQVPGFEPGLKAWKAFVLPGYTTPASWTK